MRVDLPGYGTARVPDYPEPPACNVCRCDGIEIDEWGNCAECAPREEESCEAYVARIRERRAGK